MSFTDFFIKRPVYSLVCVIVLLGLGCLAFFNLPLRQFPVVKLPVIDITTQYPGANAKIMEGFIGTPIENALVGLEGVNYVQTVNSQGKSITEVWLKSPKFLNQALTEINTRVNSITWQFPKGVLAPQIKKKVLGSPVVFFEVGSDSVSTEALTDYAMRIMNPAFESIEGVRAIMQKGTKKYSMMVYLDPHLLVKNKLTVSDVVNKIKMNSQQVAVGKLKNVGVEYNLSINSSLQSPEQFDNIVIKKIGSHLVRIKDVGRVVLGSREDGTSMSSLKYKNSILLGVEPQSTTNNIALSKKLLKKFKQLKKNFPPGIHGYVLWNTAQFSQQSVDLVVTTVWLAILFVVIVIFLFLGSLRTLLVPVLVIPLSLLGSCFVMHVLGFSLNTLTLLAFVLAIGLVVDDAIVVVENIHRNMNAGLDRLQASLKGTKEIAQSIIAMALVVISVILPIGFTSGITGALFREFSFSLVAAVFFSAVFALIFSPMLCSKILVHNTNDASFESKVERVCHRMANGYRNVLAQVLKIRYMAFVIIVALCCTSYYLITSLNSQLIPPEDQGVILVASLGPTSANLQYMEKHVRPILKVMSHIKEAQEYSIINNFSEMNKSLGFIVLRPKQPGDRTEDQIIADLKSPLSKITGLRVFAFNRPALADVTGFEAPVQFVIKTNDDYDQLYKAVKKIFKAISANPNLVNVDADLKINKPQYDITINRLRAATLGVNVEDISQTLNYLLAKPIVGWFNMNGRGYSVVPQLSRTFRYNPGQLSHIYIRSQMNKLLPLSELIHITTVTAPQTLNHFQQMRSATISANLVQGYTIGQAVDYLQNVAKKILPPSMKIDYATPTRQYVRSKGAMATIFIVALISIYLLLALKFNSFIDPIIVMMSVPLSTTGALLAMHWMGATLNIFTEIGLVMLIGLVSKHGILLVSFANQRQLEGESVVQAILDSAYIRIRPVLMTTFAMIFGALPLLFAHGAGSRSLQDIAAVIIGGMFIGSLMTLFIVPAVYTILSVPAKPRKANA